VKILIRGLYLSMPDYQRRLAAPLCKFVAVLCWRSGIAPLWATSERFDQIAVLTARSATGLEVS